jgi:hypothetical protein
METNDKMDQVRTAMFAQMAVLNKEDCDLDKELKKAAAFVQLGNVIINSVRTEIDFVRVNNQGARKTKAIQIEEKKTKRLSSGK